MFEGVQRKFETSFGRLTFRGALSVLHSTRGYRFENSSDAELDSHPGGFSSVAKR